MNVFELPVHPLADLAPMLPEERLISLADDIQENGLNEPLIVQSADAQLAEALGIEEGDYVLVDGRNRRAACGLVGIELDPDEDVVYLNGEDARVVIKSRNLERRDLNASQRAMWHACLYPEAQNKGGRGKKNPSHDVTSFSRNTLAQARYVYKHANEKVEAIMAGEASLNDEYEKAKKRVEDGAKTGKLEEMWAKAPDLAEKVQNEELPLNEAWAAYQERLHTHRMNRLALGQVLVKANAILETLTTHADNAGKNYAGEGKELEKQVTDLSLSATIEFFEKLDTVRIVAMLKAIRGDAK